MYERILLPLDGSQASQSVLGPVRKLALRTSSELVLAQVVEANPSDVGPGFQQESQDFARDYLAQVADTLSAAGVRVSFRVRPGPVVEALLALAVEERVSLFAMASHGRTASPQVPFGGVAERLIRVSPAPLFVLPALTYPAMARSREDIRRILVTTDGSDAAWAIAPRTAELALLLGASVRVLHVGSETPPDWLRNWTSLFESRGVEVRAAVEPGDPVSTILAVADREKADLIAMSTRGKSGDAGRAAAGSVTRDVLRQSPVPLLITRA